MDMDASEAPRLACPHALLVRVRAILKGDCDVDTSELVQVLRRIGSASPNLTDDANSLAEAVMRAEAPAHGDTTRKDLVTLLKMLLHGRSVFARKHRKIKAFVYSLHVDALKALSGLTRRGPGDCITLSLGEQEDLLRRALESGGIGDDENDDSESAKQALDSVTSRIASTHVARGPNEIIGDKARKRLKNARQMIDKERFTLTYVVNDDVIDLVKAKGVTGQADAYRAAQKIWKEVCFPLEIYRTAQGKEGTQAELMRDWLKSGQTWEASLLHLKKLFPTTAQKRQLPWTVREDAMKRLRDNVAKTYAPRGAR